MLETLFSNSWPSMQEQLKVPLVFKHVALAWQASINSQESTSIKLKGSPNICFWFRNFEIHEKKISNNSKHFLWRPARICKIVHVISFVIVNAIKTLVVVNTLIATVGIDVVSFVTKTPKTTERILTDWVFIAIIKFMEALVNINTFPIRVIPIVTLKICQPRSKGE